MALANTILTSTQTTGSVFVAKGPFLLYVSNLQSGQEVNAQSADLAINDPNNEFDPLTPNDTDTSSWNWNTETESSLTNDPGRHSQVFNAHPNVAWRITINTAGATATWAHYTSENVYVRGQ